MDDKRLGITYAFFADNMFIESDLFFHFVIREAIIHQRGLTNADKAKILQEEANRLLDTKEDK